MNKTKLLFLLLSFTIPLAKFGQKSKSIELKHANSLEFDEFLGKGAKRLIGNVSFEHAGALMFCDSAYLYSNNSLDAFSHIHIQQGDSIHLYGDLLQYDGNTRKAEIKKNIRLSDKDMLLTTDLLYYDMASSTANYINNGRIVNKENILISEKGYYFSSSKELVFKTNVVLTNPQYIMNSDTLRYNTLNKTAYFLGPTTIKSKENLIYCEDGWYDTHQDLSNFSKKAYILTQNQKLSGDSLFYNRKKGVGVAKKNVEIIDTTQNIIIHGNYAEHNELSDISLVTENAVLLQIYENDTLFMHADTLKAVSNKTNAKHILDINKKTKNFVDTLNNKNKTLHAYHHVKFYKSDLQGKCDSISYNYVDSIMKLFKDPILWSDKNQLTAEKMQLKMQKKGIDKLEMRNNCFIISEEDSGKYNQIKGREMTGYFAENKIKKIFVEGNGQTIYYAKDNNKLIGVNKAVCSNISIYMKNNTIEKINFITQPDATLYPIGELDFKELLLKDFKWLESERPKSRIDIWH